MWIHNKAYIADINGNKRKITNRNVFKPKEDLYAKCNTKTGEHCQFPFKHNGVLYYGCPPDPIEAGEFWCSTKVDKDGNHITGKGFYGLCKSECPKHKPGKLISYFSNTCHAGHIVPKIF